MPDHIEIEDIVSEVIDKEYKEWTALQSGGLCAERKEENQNAGKLESSVQE